MISCMIKQSQRANGLILFMQLLLTENGLSSQLMVRRTFKTGRGSQSQSIADLTVNQYYSSSSTQVERKHIPFVCTTITLMLLTPLIKHMLTTCRIGRLIVIHLSSDSMIGLLSALVGKTVSNSLLWRERCLKSMSIMHSKWQISSSSHMELELNWLH